MIKNYMELLVDNILPKVLKNYEEVCKCEKCIMDIKARTLNQLKPLYFVTEQGNVYAKLNSFEAQFETNIITELVKSIEIISKNPRHK